MSHEIFHLLYGMKKTYRINLLVENLLTINQWFYCPKFSYFILMYNRMQRTQKFKCRSETKCRCLRCSKVRRCLRCSKVHHVTQLNDFKFETKRRCLRCSKVYFTQLNNFKHKLIANINWCPMSYFIKFNFDLKKRSNID